MKKSETTSTSLEAVRAEHYALLKPSTDYELREHFPPTDSPLKGTIITEQLIKRYESTSSSALKGTTIVEQLINNCLEISWTNHDGGVLLGFERKESCVPYESRFDEQANGDCIVSNAAVHGSVERTLQPGVNYFYHFFIKVENTHYQASSRMTALDQLKNLFVRRPATDKKYIEYEVAQFSRRLPDLQAELERSSKGLTLVMEVTRKEKQLRKEFEPPKSKVDALREEKEQTRRLAMVGAEEDIKTRAECWAQRNEAIAVICKMQERGEITTEEADRKIQDVKDIYVKVMEKFAP